MSRTKLATCLALCALSGCANYDSSRFQYQSGGLPFLGMTLAVGNDRNEDVPVRHADGRGLNVTSRPSLVSQVPDVLSRWLEPNDGISSDSERLLR